MLHVFSIIESNLWHAYQRQQLKRDRGSTTLCHACKLTSVTDLLKATFNDIVNRAICHLAPKPFEINYKMTGRRRQQNLLKDSYAPPSVGITIYITCEVFFLKLHHV
jgi:hypothetical protein